MAIITYEAWEKKRAELLKLYPISVCDWFGQSVLGRKLTALRLGSGKKKLFINASHHGLEYLTTAVAAKFAEDYLEAYDHGTKFLGRDIRELWNQVTVFICPLVNPDGVDLAVNGLTKEHPFYYQIKQWCGGDHVQKVWQANARGVDLNHNYDAMWMKAKKMEVQFGIVGPAPTRYGGSYPLSEPESRALAYYTDCHAFDMVIALHSQCEEIYWRFMALEPPEAYDIGKKLAKAAGYRLSETTGIASYGGYKDWFIAKYRKPGYTVEIGLGENPLPVSDFKGIYEKVAPMLLTAVEVLV